MSTLIAPIGGLAFVEVPQLAWDGAGVEEVGADRDHHVDVAGFDELAAHLGLAVPCATGLRGHDEAGAALRPEVAVEVGNPEVVTVRDFLRLVHAGKAERKRRSSFTFSASTISTLNGGLAMTKSQWPNSGWPSCKRCTSS